MKKLIYSTVAADLLGMYRCDQFHARTSDHYGAQSTTFCRLVRSACSLQAELALPSSMLGSSWNRQCRRC
jgi:hypothetical protein